MSTKRIIVIGGSAAGPKAASKARRMDEHAEILRRQYAFTMDDVRAGVLKNTKLSK